MTTKRRRTLPPVSPKVSAELRPLVSAIAEIIETGEGVRGDPLDRKLTLRDLLDSGIGRLRNGLPPSNPGALQPGTGAPDLSTPPKPVGFEAVAAFDGEVFLTWETPQRLYSNHALTNIYRAESDNFANAERIGQEPGMFYIDNVRADASQKTYYYWISFTSTSDVEGPVNDTAGTPVTTILSPEYIIDKINGLISKSELANDVLTPINQIPSINTTLADHAGRIQSTEAALSDLLNVPAYDTGTDYAVDDLVSYNGFTWRALVAMTAPAPTPTEGANWTQVGQYATFGDIIAGNAVAIDDLDVRVTSAEGSITSYGTEITGIKTRLTNTENGTTANSTAINTLDGRVTQTEQGISANSSDITQLQNDLSTAENGITANSQALSLLDSRVGSAEGTITSQGQAVTQLQSDLNNLASTASANASAINSLTTRVTSAEGSLSSVAQDVSQLQVSVGDNSAAIQTKAEVSAVQGIADDVAVLSAQYTVKLDVNGRVAGIGLANNNGVTSFVVASDSVYFIDPGQSITAFNPDTNYASMAALRNTQFVFGYAQVEGQRRFAINVPAYIPELYVENAMLKDLAVTRAKIANLAVNGAKIDIADIWELNIGNEVKSDNYSVGNSGWRIDRNGNSEFNNSIFRGQVEVFGGSISGSTAVDGSTLSAIKSAAEAADTSLFRSWVRPGTTLIDGNQIFTGDAYVDTLQIKGQAVTLPVSAQRTVAYSIPNNGNWATILSLSFNNPNSFSIPVIIIGTLHSNQYFGWTGQLVVRGSVAFSMAMISDNTNMTISYVATLPPGASTIYLRARDDLRSGFVTRQINVASIVCVGAQR